MPIDEDEELERISAMMQRDSLVRSLGVVDQVHRMLSGTSPSKRGNEDQKVGIFQRNFIIWLFSANVFLDSNLCIIKHASSLYILSNVIPFTVLNFLRF